MKNILTVKTWIITTDNGDTFEIYAPNRLLARLNFRAEIGYAPIKSVGLKRN